MERRVLNGSRVAYQLSIEPWGWDTWTLFVFGNWTENICIRIENWIIKRPDTDGYVGESLTVDNSSSPHDCGRRSQAGLRIRTIETRLIIDRKSSEHTRQRLSQITSASSASGMKHKPIQFKIGWHDRIIKSFWEKTFNYSLKRKLWRCFKIVDI